MRMDFLGMAASGRIVSESDAGMKSGATRGGEKFGERSENARRNPESCRVGAQGAAPLHRTRLLRPRGGGDLDGGLLDGEHVGAHLVPLAQGEAVSRSEEKTSELQH